MRTACAGVLLHADGSYTFDASNVAYQSLGVGQSATLTVPFTVTDDQGATSSASLVITVTGTKDETGGKTTMRVSKIQMVSSSCAK